MARLVFPSDRLVYQSSTYAGTAFTSAAGATATVYADSAGIQLADVQNFDGSANAAATFTVDATSRLPLFLGPADGTDTLYVKVASGPVTPIYAVTAGDISAAVATEVTNRTAAVAAAVAASSPRLTRTAVKTANYTAAAGDLVPCDTTTAAFTVTLPNAPVVGSRVAVKLVTLGAGHFVTIACAGSDVFNKAGGATTAQLTLLGHAMNLQYDTGGVWTVVADDIPKTALDGAYPALPTGATKGIAATIPRLADLTQIVIPHDNAGLVNPKDTIDGARALIASGWTGVLDWNVQMAGDGTLFCMHDATVDPQTTSSGNGYDQTAASIAQLIVDNVPAPWSTTTIRVPTVAQVLEAFPNVCHHFEVKSGSTYGQTSRFAFGVVGQALVNLVTTYGRQDSVIISSFTDSELQPARVAGIATMIILPTEGFPTDYTGATMTAASLYASGTRYINPDFTRSTIAADVPAWQAIGLKVLVGTPDRRVDRTTSLTTWGANGYITNNPLYLSRSVQSRKVDLWKSGARTDGLIGYDSTHQGVVTGGGLRINTTGTLFVLMGDVSYGESSVPATYSITFGMKCNAVGSDVTRHWDMFMGAPTDVKFQDVAAATENGYLLFHKPNGAGNIQTKTAGVNGTASGGTITTWTTGDDLTYRLDVTATTIKLTLVTKNAVADGSVLFNFTTSAWRGGYFFLGRNDGGGAGSGLDVTFHDLILT